MVKGMRYADYLEHQKQEYEHEMRLKKEEKVRMKQAELSQEVHYGSKSKRKCNGGTPMKSAKMPRVSAMCSNAIRTLYGTIKIFA